VGARLAGLLASQAALAGLGPAHAHCLMYTAVPKKGCIAATLWSVDAQQRSWWLLMQVTGWAGS
jgi:hypothetical protein